jgi:hypothetical protein
LDLEAIKILNLAAIWNFSEGTGLFWVNIKEYGAERARL